MRKIFLLIVCSIVSWQYVIGLNHLLSYNYLFYNDKPFIYRQLVPILASFLPFPTRENISIVVFCFCIGLSISMLYLYEMSWKTSLMNDTLFLISFTVTILVLMIYQRFYDIPTAFFFVTILILWMKEKFLLSIPVFILACINRETAILLTAFFIPMFWRKMNYRLWGNVALQVSGYFAMRMVILKKFGVNGGSSIYMRPIENIRIYLSSYWTILLVVVFLVIFYRISQNAKVLDRNILLFLIVLFPMLAIMHLISGYPLEVRVFAEIMPVMFLSAILR